MSSKVLRTPRHVSLRTQQRRLRHIRSLAVRNLAPLEQISRDPHSLSIFFTIHDPEGSEKVLYKSSFVQGSYNPLWGSLNFSYSVVNDASVLSSFVLRVWGVIEEREVMCIEMVVNLSKFMYLGLTMQRKGHSEYPSNTVIIGMFESYYVPASAGGYPPPPRCTNHSLASYLPDMSLLEVKKSEVGDAYLYQELKNLNAHQRRLDHLREMVKQDKQQLFEIKKRKETLLKKEIEESLLKAKVQLLQAQLTEKRSLLEEKSKRLDQFRKEINDRETLLSMYRHELAGKKFKMEKDVLETQNKKDQLVRVQRQLHVRQRSMIAELAETFCIKQINEAFTICDVILPNGDPILDGTPSEQTAVALGFVAHLVHLLGKFLIIPLQFPIKPVGSRSLIYDHFHEEQNLDIKEFPLYFKGVEKTLYQFGLYLLWRDILQVRQHCGFNTSKGSAKKTLPNLKGLLDKLMKDKYSIYPIPDPLGSSEPHLPTATNPRLPLQAHPSLPQGSLLASPSQHLPQDARKNGRLDSPQHNGTLYKSSPKSLPLNLAQFRDSPDEQSGPVQYNIEFSSSDPLSRRSAVLTNSSVTDTLPSSLPHSNTSPKLIPRLHSPSKSPLVSSPSPPPQTDEGDEANNMDDAYLYFQEHADALHVIADLETL